MFGFRSKYANATYGVIAFLVILCFVLSLSLIVKTNKVVIKEVPVEVIKEVTVIKEVPVEVIKEVIVTKEVLVSPPQQTKKIVGKRTNKNIVQPEPYVVELNGCMFKGAKNKALTPIDPSKNCY